MHLIRTPAHEAHREKSAETQKPFDGPSCIDGLRLRCWRDESQHMQDNLALAFHGQDTWLQWGADGYQKNLRAEMEGNKGMILKQFEEDAYHYPGC